MIAFHLNPTCSLQPFLQKNSEGVSRHGAIMAFSQRGSPHQLRNRHFVWAMPFVSIIRSWMLYWRPFGNVHHNCVVFICQLVPRVESVSTLSHVCCSSFKICKKEICCVVGMVFTPVESNALIGAVMSIMMI